MGTLYASAFAVGDGKTDDSAGLQKMFDIAAANYDDCVIDLGIVYIGTPVFLTGTRGTGVSYTTARVTGLGSGGTVAATRNADFSQARTTILCGFSDRPALVIARTAAVSISGTSPSSGKTLPRSRLPSRSIRRQATSAVGAAPIDTHPTPESPSIPPTMRPRPAIRPTATPT